MREANERTTGWISQIKARCGAYHARMWHGPSRAASSMLCEGSERADNRLDNVVQNSICSEIFIRLLCSDQVKHNMETADISNSLRPK